MGQQNIVSCIISVNESNSERKLLEFSFFVARVFTSSVPFMSYCSVGVALSSSSSSSSVNFSPQNKLSLLFVDQVILLGRHSLVIVKTVCWVFLSCQCYGSLCKLICFSQCLSFVK